jgi:hypothetical protein
VLAASAIWLSFAVSGCGNPNPNLFGANPELSGGGNPSAGSLSAAGTSGLEAGGSDNASGGETVAGSASIAGFGGNGGSGAGCAFSCGEGGNGGGGLPGGSDQAGAGSELTECSAVSADATFLPSTQHCYLVDSEPRTFAAAQTHCKELKAHLVTLASEAENDFAWSLHSDEHWIGSQDGKMPKQSGVGKYTWITNEPFEYANWSPDQPNASMTDCVEGGACYEHCAFQWKGGDHDSQWNDRYCMHTIASICEWDSAR